MKKAVVLLLTLLTVISVVMISCTKTQLTTTTTQPATTAATQGPTVEGNLTDVNPGASEVTITTPQGPETVSVGPSTTFAINGRACTLADIDALQETGQSLDCTIIYDAIGNAVYVDVTTSTTPASVSGTITDVNVAASTITVKTTQGDKVYDVDPSTGLVLGGQVCTLDQVSALLDAGVTVPCTVIYTVDDQGTAIYVDIQNPPQTVSTTGTIKSVNETAQTITVQTAQGDKVFQIGGDTGLVLGRDVCTLTLINDLIAAGENLPCTILATKDKQGQAIYVDVANPPNSTEIAGSITDVNPAKSTITVQTATGDKVLTVSPDTGIVLGGGQVCDLATLDALQTTTGEIPCTIVATTGTQGQAIYIDIANPPSITSDKGTVAGTITDVNLAKSTITVKTSQGEKVYDVDPTTGLVIGGNVCSLDLLNALSDAGGTLPCTILASTDNQGQAIYVDIANPPNITSGTGTITDINTAKSTVTIQTDKGLRTFAVDPKDGSFLNGQVCSLTEIVAFADAGATFSTCEVAYYTDSQGNLVYIDVTRP